MQPEKEISTGEKPPGEFTWLIHPQGDERFPGILYTTIKGN
jgi:hypothetical protein